MPLISSVSSNLIQNIRFHGLNYWEQIELYLQAVVVVGGSVLVVSCSGVVSCSVGVKDIRSSVMVVGGNAVLVLVEGVLLVVTTNGECVTVILGTGVALFGSCVVVVVCVSVIVDVCGNAEEVCASVTLLVVSCVAGLLIVVVSSEATDDFAAIVVDSAVVIVAGSVCVVIYSVVGDDLLGAAVVCVVSVLVSYFTPVVVTSIALVDGTVVCVSECCLTGTVVVSSCNGCDVGVVVKTVVVFLEYVQDGSWSVVYVGIVVVSDVSTVLVISGVLSVYLADVALVLVIGEVVSVFWAKLEVDVVPLLNVAVLVCDVVPLSWEKWVANFVVWLCLTVIVVGAVVSVSSTKPIVVVVLSVVIVKRLVAGVSVFWGNLGVILVVLVSRAEVVVGAVGAVVDVVALDSWNRDVVDIVVWVPSIGAKVLSVNRVAAGDFSTVTDNSVVAVSEVLASIVFIAGDAVSNGLFVTKLGRNVGIFVETTTGRAVGVRSDTGCGASVPVLLRFVVSLGIGVIVVVGNGVEGSVGQLVTVVGGNDEMGLVRNDVILVVTVDITVVETIKINCELFCRKNY